MIVQHLLLSLLNGNRHLQHTLGCVQQSHQPATRRNAGELRDQQGLRLKVLLQSMLLLLLHGQWRLCWLRLESMLLLLDGQWGLHALRLEVRMDGLLLQLL